MDDVRLQQLDPVLDRHVEDFVGREVGQFHAGLVDGRQLLLLLDLVGHVADGDDQVPGGPFQLRHRGGMDLEIAVVLAPQRGTGALAGGQGRVERAEVGPQDLRAAQGRVEIDPRHRFAAAPLAHPAVAPEDRVVAFEHGHAVGHALEDLLVLQQLADLEGLLEVFGGDEDAVERSRVSRASARIGLWTSVTSCTPLVPASNGSTFSRESQTSRILGFSGQCSSAPADWGPKKS